MRSDKITNGQGFMLTVLVLMTNSYSVVYGSSAATGVVFANLLATLVAAGCAYLLGSVCDKYPEKSFCSVVKALFGASFGSICAFLCVILALTSGVVSLVVFNRFIQLTALPQTPQIIIPLILVLVFALSFRRGLCAIAGSARLLFWFGAFVFIVFCVFGINFAHPEVLLPMFGDATEFLKAAGEVFINRFGTLFALMAVYTRMRDEKSRRRVFVSGVATAGVAFSVISFMTAAILGTDALGRDFYPAYTAMSIIEAGGFLQHPEILSSIIMTVCAFFKTAVCILFAEDILFSLFDVPIKEGAAVPIGLICVSATQLMYRNAPALRKMTEWKTLASVVLGFEILLPVALAGVWYIFRRRRMKKR